MKSVSCGHFFKFIARWDRWLYLSFASLNWTSLTCRLYPQDFGLDWRVRRPAWLPVYFTSNSIRVEKGDVILEFMR